MLYSFDVFDTLISRTTATPKGIFSLVQKILQEKYKSLHQKTRQNFYQLRVDAERMARYLYCKGEIEDITLEQIYSVMKTMAFLSEEEVSVLYDLELDAEIINSIPINKNIDYIVRHINCGDRVVLISDMYLSSKDIRRLLVKHHPIFQDIPIYVSSECKKTKGSGNLYRYIRKKELVFWDNWKHLGDNPNGDVKIPRSLGMHATHYRFEPLLSCEKKLLENHEMDAYLQLFIGSSRNRRLNYGNNAPKQIGTTYGAAVLLQYMLWVLGICNDNGIEDLYFVARDGYVLLQIANVLKDRGFINCNLKYIYGSRNAWRTRESMPLYADNYDVYGKSSEEMEMLQSYLRQEIDLKSPKIGFVEVHGDGVTQRCLGDILNRMTGSQISSFYFILERMQENDNQTFYRFTTGKEDLGCVIETFTRALHGRTVSYERKDGRIVPILAEDEEKGLENYGYKDYLLTVSKTVDEYLRVLDENHMSAYGFGYGLEYYQYLIEKEKGIVLDYIGDMPLSNTREGTEKLYLFAPKPTKEEIEAVKDKGYLDQMTWCSPFSMRRLSTSEKKQITDNKKYYLEKQEEKRKQQSEKNKGYLIQYIVSKEKLKKRIALYGAGKIGKSIYKYITDNRLAEIVVWTDRIYKRKDGIVDYIKHLPNYDFDQIVIAIKNADIVSDIKTDLLVMGYDEKMIYWEEYRFERVLQ